MTGVTAPEARTRTGFDFDYSSLLDLVGGDGEFLGEFIDLFDRDSSRLLVEVREASRFGGAPLGRAAHALMGLLSYFGDSKALEHCRQLEAIGLEWEPAEAGGLAAALAREVALIRAGLDRLAACPAA